MEREQDILRPFLELELMFVTKTPALVKQCQRFHRQFNRNIKLKGVYQTSRCRRKLTRRENNLSFEDLRADQKPSQGNWNPSYKASSSTKIWLWPTQLTESSEKQNGHFSLRRQNRILRTKNEFLEVFLEKEDDCDGGCEEFKKLVKKWGCPAFLVGIERERKRRESEGKVKRWEEKRE